MRREDMPSPAILAQLLAQAESEGADLITLRAMVEEASELGAQRVLGAIGLDDGRGAARQLLGEIEHHVLLRRQIGCPPVLRDRFW